MLGLAPFAGGFGAAVAGGLSAVGLPVTGAIGSALTGAVTQAGFGAAIGGGIGAITGQGFEKGATMGALGGAVIGGVGGFLSPTAAAPGITQSARNMPTGLGGALPNPASSGALSSDQIAQSVANSTMPGAAAPAVPYAPSPTTQFTDAARQAGGGGLGQAARTGLGKFLESPIAGQAIAGGAQGLLAGMAAKDAGEDDHYKDYRASYDIGRQEGDTLPQPDRMSVSDRFGRPAPTKGRWRYDRASGDVVYG
jgi:hypothetical protein